MLMANILDPKAFNSEGEGNRMKSFSVEIRGEFCLNISCFSNLLFQKFVCEFFSLGQSICASLYFHLYGAVVLI